MGNYFDPNEPSLEETVMSLNETRLVHAPNTRTKYSNAAVSVAGYAVEKVVGKPFAEHMKESLLIPLGNEGAVPILLTTESGNTLRARKCGHMTAGDSTHRFSNWGPCRPGICIRR